MARPSSGQPRRKTDAVQAKERLVELKVGIDGMHCSSCVQQVEQALQTVPGVRRAKVALTTNAAIIVYDESVCKPVYISQAIARAGYRAQAGQARRRSGTAGWLPVAQAALLTGIILVLLIGDFAIPGLDYILSVLSLLVLFGPGHHILFSAIKSILRLRPNMDVLVSLGATAALTATLLSVYYPAWWPGDGKAPRFYDAATIIITVVLLGRFLEARIRRKHLNAVDSLLSVLPEDVAILRGKEEERVPLDQVQVGDTVVIRGDQTIPVDGVISKGNGTVDESFLTGESMARDCHVGQVVLAGSLNRAGLMRVEAHRVGADTTLCQMAGLLERAQTTRPQITRLADLLGAVFVPAVLALAAGAFCFWLFVGHQWLPPETSAWSMALATGLAVVVVSCPCALGLATPAAIAAGVARAGELGIFFKEGAAIEALAKVDTVCLDKTGTLTIGSPRLEVIDPAQGFTPHDVLGLAAKLEHGSDHPMAVAILAAAAECGIPTEGASGLETVPGMGVRGVVKERQVLLGRPEFLTDAGIDLGPIDASLGTHAEAGLSPFCMAIDGQAAAVFAIGDAVRADAEAAIQAYHAIGLRTIMLTGDIEAVADAVAVRLGIQGMAAGLLPEDKVGHIQDLQKEGHIVAMLGDGINDGPALRQAQVSLAVGTGTNVAIDSADAIVPANDLTSLCRAIALSRTTMRRIKQNLWIAFAYNFIAIPLAAGLLFPWTGLLVHPGLAATFMAGSSLLVVGNSLRLKRWSPAGPD